MEFKYTEMIKLVIDKEMATHLEYTLNDNIMSINGVFTDEKHRGKGLSKDIVLEAVSFAKKNGYKIMPVCPYVVNMFDKGGFEDIDAR